MASGAEVRNSSGEILHSIPMDRKILPKILESLADLDLSIRFCVNGADYVIGEVMVFGDSMNDYSMLSMDFGATIAMENGLEEIREVAKYVTKSNEEDGVAYVIEELLKN